MTKYNIYTRIVVAIFGGYFLANMMTIIMYYIFHNSKSEAVMLGMLMSFPFYVAVIMWAFTSKATLKTLSLVMIIFFMITAVPLIIGELF